MRRKTIDIIPVLSDAVKSILSAFSKSRSLPSGLVKRASIVLFASQGELNQEEETIYTQLSFDIEENDKRTSSRGC